MTAAPTLLALFRVDGHPKPQPRPRAFARKMGDKTVARVFQDGTPEEWKSRVISTAREWRPEEPLDVPVSVVLGFELPRPKSRCRKKDPQGPIPCVSRPDLDNLAKAVLDAMTQDGWWVDDSRVVRLAIFKDWHSVGGRPGVEVSVSVMESN